MSNLKKAPVMATDQSRLTKNLPNINTETSIVTEQLYDYLQYCEHKKKNTPDTLKTKYYHINQFVRENGIEDLCAITNKQLDGWCYLKIYNGMKEKTANGHIDDIVGCLRFLKVKRGLDITLDLEAVERYTIRTDETTEDLPGFSAQDIQFIKLHCKTLLEELAFSMTYESAMRLHEITHLCIEDMRQNDNGKIYFRITGKGTKKRNTFVLPQTVELLERWLSLTGIYDGYIFPSPVKEGRPYTRTQFRKILTQPIRRAGFIEGSPHALRRSAITEALENGMPLAKVAKWAGHADSRVTLRHYYRHNNRRLQEQHQEALQASFNQTKTLDLSTALAV